MRYREWRTLVLKRHSEPNLLILRAEDKAREDRRKGGDGKERRDLTPHSVPVDVNSLSQSMHESHVYVLSSALERTIGM